MTKGLTKRAGGTAQTPEAEITELHGEIVVAMQSSLTKGLRIGELIQEQKDSLAHGEFGPWLRTLPFTERTARRYMRLHEHRGRLETDNVSDLSEAYKLLTEPKRLEHAEVTRNVSSEKRIPLADKSVEERREFCRTWFDQLSKMTVLLNADGWATGDIAEYLGVEEWEVQRVLRPELPDRLNYEFGARFGEDGKAEYRKEVAGTFGVWDMKAYSYALHAAQTHGFSQSVCDELEMMHQRADRQWREAKDRPRVMDDLNDLMLIIHCSIEDCRAACGICHEQPKSLDALLLEGQEIMHLYDKGFEALDEMRDALIAIRDERLFRETHDTFAEYVDEKWPDLPEQLRGLLAV